MEAAPEVSVIITSYNIEGYISRAVESALAQEGVTVEVVVADDCSTDGTWAALSAINDARVKTIRMEKNGGPSVARNAAIAQASGRWLAVLDGDDVFMPGRLMRIVAKAREAKADLVVDNLLVCREDNGERALMFESEEFESRGRITLEDYIAGNRGFISGYGLGYLKPMVSRDFLTSHTISYRPTIRIGEDYVFMMELLASGAVCAVEPQGGYGYTVRKGSISHRLTKADVERIQREDAAFHARYPVSTKALEYQRQRTRNLMVAYDYNALVEQIKVRDYGAAIRTALKNPAAALYLSLPLKVRLVRLLGKNA